MRAKGDAMCAPTATVPVGPCVRACVDLEALCWAVEVLAPFGLVVYQKRFWTRAGGPNADSLLPYPTIRGKGTSLSKTGRKAVKQKQNS
jgi:hypothetical protein